MNRSHVHSVLLIVLTVLALVVVGGVAPRAQSKTDLALKAAMDKEVVDGDLKAAIELYRQIAKSGDRAIAARALVRMGQCYEKLGDAEAKEARAAYERVVRDFGDQAEVVAQARVRLAAMSGPGRAGGLVTRRILPDASDVSGALTTDGKFIRGLDWETGDVIQFDLASRQTSRITNSGPWSEAEKSYDSQAFSRDGRRIAYNSFTKDWVPQLRMRNLDGSCACGKPA